MIYLGIVTCDLHIHSSRARVEIGGHGATKGIPLSVKAGLNGFSRNYFTRGRAVEVEQNPSDGRVFRVTKVFEALDRTKEITVNTHFDIKVKDAEAFRKKQEAFVEWFGKQKYGNKNWSETMSHAMSHDRVRLFIGDCYYNSGCKKDAIIDVLEKAFRLGPGHSESLMKAGYGGFYIVCRPSQFARFMIYRNDAGQKNGFMDLQPKLFTPEPKVNVRDQVSRMASVDRYLVDRVLKALGLACDQVEELLADKIVNDDDPPEVDVSHNKARPQVDPNRC